MSTAIRRFVRDLDIDAYVVGGAVRDELLGIPHKDEDFVVPGVDHAGLRATLEPYGRVDDMEVHGQLVGVRLHPRDQEVRALAPAGIELTPLRTERSTGPSHRDFEIVADGTVSLEEDMARRDFTVNALARRLATGELVDPFGGATDLARRELRTVSERSFADDPLRMLRGLRLVSQLDFSLAGETLAEMRREAAGLRHVSAERIGGGLTADGMGELSRLLLGSHPGRALRLARETGLLVTFLPEFEPAIGFAPESSRRSRTLDEHMFAVVDAAAELGVPLAVRLAALLHDLGKPVAALDGGDHAEIGATIAAGVLSRLRYPVPLQTRVVRIVRHHAFRFDGPLDARAARRFLHAHGTELAFELVAHKEADLSAKSVPEQERCAVVTLRSLLEQERASPHRLADLAVTGTDLLAIGYRQGPQLGVVLRGLLAAVVDEPALNERAALLARARASLS